MPNHCCHKTSVHGSNLPSMYRRFLFYLPEVKHQIGFGLEADRRGWEWGYN